MSPCYVRWCALPALMALVTGLIAPAALAAPTAQAALDRFAQTAGYRFTILDNQTADGVLSEIELTLPKTLPQTPWSLYVGMVIEIKKVESDHFTFTHLNGDMYRLTPKPGVTLKPGATYKIRISGPGHLYSEFFALPNIYVAADNLKARTLAATRPHIDASTGLESLPFMAPMRDEAKLVTTHPALDASAWLTPERAFAQNTERGGPIQPDVIILPTPVSATRLTGAPIDLAKGIALTLSGLTSADIRVALSDLHVKRAKGGVPVKITLDAKSGTPESYHLVARDGAIAITAADPAGASYALRSLAQQAKFEHYRLKPVEISDAPRFGFRGLHLDLARNFDSQAHILAVIDQMAAYKLNRLHLHLGDDEGWRLAIAALPELTEIGSRRCHDLKEDTCLLPQLGAGPDNAPGINGYLSRADYIEILKAARARQIEVIPSFDMPGHSRAAVRSMEARYRRLMAEGKPTEATQYRLQDPADTTVYDSVQHYNDNTLNICLPATYAFIDTVIETIADMHKAAGLPLKRYHIGADETAGAWTHSPACQAMMADAHITPAQMTPYFIEKVAKTLSDKGIEPAGWSDGLSHVDPAHMPRIVQSNSWGSLFGGGIHEAHQHANQGWDVILSTPDVLYFDMPNALDPKERGYDWASRTTDLYKVFAFLPENLPANASVMRDIHAKGATMADTVPLSDGHRITGMQGQLWSETVRGDKIADYMLFPRTLALAERAWHTGAWEPAYTPGKSYSFGDGQVDEAKLNTDWQAFNAKLAPALAELEARGIAYRLPVPGAQVKDGILSANLAYGDLPIQYRLEGGQWRTYNGPVKVSGPVDLRTLAPGNKRFSRTVTVR